MVTDILNKYISKLLLCTFTCVLFLPIFTYAQSQIHQFLYNQPPEQPKSIFEIIFNLSETNRGVLAQSLKEKSSVVKKLQQDTKKENKIVIRESGDNFLVDLCLDDKDQKINISIYNLLGKKVMDVFDGIPASDSNGCSTHFIQGNNLPNGIYLCVVLGKNFRLREKFYVKR